MSAEPFLSRGNLFTGRVPQGWFSASDDSLAAGLSAWVVREDLSAALAVAELHIDHLAAQRVNKEGLELLASISMAFQTSGKKNVDIDLPPKNFSIRGKKYCGYEFSEGSTQKRVVVFSAAGRYFECVAAPTKGTFSPDDTRRLFTAQQAFVASLTF